MAAEQTRPVTGSGLGPAYAAVRVRLGLVLALFAARRRGLVVDRRPDAGDGRGALDLPGRIRLVPRRLGRDDGGDDVPVGRPDRGAVLPHDQDPASAGAGRVHRGLSPHLGRRGCRRLDDRPRHQPSGRRRPGLGQRRTVARRGHRDRRGGLRAHPAERRLPRQVPQPTGVPAGLLARRAARRPADGSEERRLVRGLLLGPHGRRCSRWAS